jgi:hypothetical protein
MPELLTLKLLERLDNTLRGLGALIVECWEPGLSREQMDALTAPHGFRLPDEAALWWGWHNGGGGADLTPDRRPRTLESVMRNFENVQGGMSDAWGLVRLVGVVNGEPWLWFDCRGEHDAPVPVYAGYKAEKPWVAAESIGDMVLILIAGFESGAFTTDERGEWNETDRSKIPETIEDLGII